MKLNCVNSKHGEYNRILLDLEELFNFKYANLKTKRKF